MVFEEIYVGGVAVSVGSGVIGGGLVGGLCLHRVKEDERRP